MKRRLLYLAPILLVLASLGASFIQPPQAIAASSAAASDCNSTESGGTPGDIKSCEQGYDGAVAGKSKIDACPNSMGEGSRDPNSLSQAQCNAGWTDGEAAVARNKGTTPTPPTSPSPAAQQDCNKTESGSAPSIAACEIGYDDAASGQPQDPTCAALGSGSKTLGSSSDCDQGYKDYGAVKAEDDATCPTSTYPGSQQAACIAGLSAAQAGQDDSVCASKSGSDQTACEAGFKAGGGTPSVGGSTAPPSCEASGFSLSWILCPIIEGAANATDGIYNNIVKPLLVTKPIELTNPSSDPTHTYDIWSNFRVYGDIFLVIALLVIVFGESLGGGLIDAYSAKKILPRLLIAAVLINLSIYLVALAVDLTNIIGSGIANLIEAPFTISGAYTLHIGGATGDLGVAGLLTGGIWAAAGGGALIEFLLLMVMIPAFLTFVAILVTVILRQGLIVLLVLVSPVAFALYCLPNTEQYFRKWWDLLLRTLLVYPLIAILFALGNVLSVTINSTASGITGSLTALLSVFALFAPLFLIPYSFRIAGGLLGRFHDLATTTRQRAHEGIKGNASDPDSWRRRSRSKLRQRYAERGMDGKGLATNVIPPTNPLSRSGRREWRQNREARRASSRTILGQQFFENDSVAKANKGNDQYYQAVASRRVAEAKRDALPVGSPERASWDQAIAASRITPSSQAIRMAAAQQLSTTGFQLSQGQQGYNELAETMADITGAQLTRRGNNVMGATGPRAGAFSDAMDNAQYNLRNAGRYDLGGINRGAGYDAQTGTSKASLYELANAKPESIRGMMDGLPYGPGVSNAHAVAYKELQSMLPNSKGGTRDEIVKQIQNLQARGVEDYMSTPTGRASRGRVTYDPKNPSAGTWSNEERTRGWRMDYVPETNSDIAQRTARSYERPDPNHIT
ncbi:MAG TPA: MFS transporter [Verrucomicrobiae bacterium]|jgi:hypothetical protein|nr:MFS transporter [Verrucomicrobiae bacterium]